MSGATRFTKLATDAVRDALRNRIGLLAILFALAIGVFADRCTGIEGGSFVVNGRLYDVSDGARLVGPLLYGLCALTLVWVAGLVACDSLARPLSEGTASLVLSRPVGRRAYALARLAGALAISVGAGASVLLAVAFLLQARFGLDLAPGLVALGVFAVDAWVVAAVAMTLSLWLPRLVALAAVTIGLQLVVAANLFYTVAESSGGMLSAIERFGPPLATSLVLALSPWFSDGAVAGDWLEPALRLGVWGIGATALLVAIFGREEIAA